jgi:hypothetical protein
MRRVTGVVIGESCADISGQSNVVAPRIVFASQHIHEALLVHAESFRMADASFEYVKIRLRPSPFGLRRDSLRMACQAKAHAAAYTSVSEGWKV